MRGLLTGNSLLRGFTLLARTSGGFNQINTFRVARFSAQPVLDTAEQVTVTFVTQEGEEQTVVAKKGQSLLDVAHANNIELEGACEGSLACSTCHVVVDPEFYAKLPEPRDEENDMLDLAFGLTETSRLGCQVILNEQLNNIRVRVPSVTRNLAVDGYKPKPH